MFGGYGCRFEPTGFDHDACVMGRHQLRRARGIEGRGLAEATRDQAIPPSRYSHTRGLRSRAVPRATHPRTRTADASKRRALSRIRSPCITSSRCPSSMSSPRTEAHGLRCLLDACLSSCFELAVGTAKSGGTSTTLVPSRDDRRVILKRAGLSTLAAFGPRFNAHRVTHAMPSGRCSPLRTWTDYNHTLPVADTKNLTKVREKLLISGIVLCTIR